MSNDQTPVDVAASIAIRAEEFDQIFCVCQKRDGGLVVFHLDDMRVESAVYLLEAAKVDLLLRIREG